MKRLLSLLSAFIIMILLCGCQGTFGSVNLNDPIQIPENGIISDRIIKQIKSENSIGVFTGEDSQRKYEWTIFGTDITEPKEINLALQLSTTSEGHLQVTLKQARSFGFSALLSIYLDEKWEAQSATAYTEHKGFTSVSLTGSKFTIVNLTLDGSVDCFEIRPDILPQESTTGPSKTEEATTPTAGNDDYLSKPQNGDSTVYSGGKDQYLTDPVPEGKPTPVEPENQQVNTHSSLTCTFSIECSTILNNLEQLEPDKLEMVPSDGVILPATTVTFYEGESVFDVLQRVCKEKGIHMEASWTPIYNSAYVEGIHNLYEFDCGNLSGWMYRVNGWYPNYGSSRYQLQDGDVVQWRYTCDLGSDIDGRYATGG